MFNAWCSRIAPPPSTIRRTSPSQMLHRRPMSPLVAPRNALSVFTSSPVLGLPFKSPPLGKCLPQSTQETLTHLFLQQKPVFFRNTGPSQSSLSPGSLIKALISLSPGTVPAPCSVPKRQQGTRVHQSLETCSMGLRGPLLASHKILQKAHPPFSVPLLSSSSCLTGRWLVI